MVSLSLPTRTIYRIVWEIQHGLGALLNIYSTIQGEPKKKEGGGGKKHIWGHILGKLLQRGTLERTVP